ncbi:MAG: xanthine dehydrogenase [Polaromonas sp.]|nr:xanthine dehydrogenase [Polaromonas sp.]
MTANIRFHLFLSRQKYYFDKTNPLKIKGVGELGISGAGAALANAVFNACGVRIRYYPLTLDKVIAGLPLPA